MISVGDHQKRIVINLDRPGIIFDYMENGVLITNDCSQILYTNPAFTRITGYTQEEVKGKNPGMLHSGQHDELFYKNMWTSINKKGFWEGEIWNRQKSGKNYPEYLTITKIIQDNLNNFIYIAVFSDISYLEKDINKKLNLAFYDPMTELPNRNLFMDRINKSLVRDKSSPPKTVAIFYMDLDKFKPVNDTYGHCVGDKLLKMVGKRLSKLTRADDTIARIGGDEFAAIITTYDNQFSFTDLAERIVNKIEEPFNIDGYPISISISIGISISLKGDDDVETLLARADKAMYIAKKGQSKIEFDNSVGLPQ